jgi:periplasmic protein TonB
MFEDSTFESTGRIRTRSRRWMIATFAFNGSVLLALILIPLIYPEALPNKLMSILLTAPPPPAASQPPKQEPTRAFRGERQLTDLGLTIPTRIPTTINRLQGQEAAPIGPTMLTMDQGGPAIPGGDPFRRSSQPLVQPAPRPSSPAHISSGVAAGMLIQKVQPQYPALGKAIRIEGTVILQAVISKSGAIENLRVVSGPPMLQQSAIDAVKQWRYRPYLLDGEPVEVETTINVIFSLGH